MFVNTYGRAALMFFAKTNEGTADCYICRNLLTTKEEQVFTLYVSVAPDMLKHTLVLLMITRRKSAQPQPPACVTLYSVICSRASTTSP